MEKPFEQSNPTELLKITRRTSDDLPAHVKDLVKWRTREDGALPGYYVYDPREDRHQPVEFIDNHWHKLFVYSGTAYVSLSDRIDPFTQGTGYWKTSDPQHPHYHEHLSTLAQQASEVAQQIAQEQEETRRTRERVPTLAIVTGTSPLESDAKLSPFLTPRVPSAEKSSSSDDARHSTEPEREPSPELEYQDDPVLEAQLQYGLDIQEREQENPYTPDTPAYQQLIEAAVEAGYNVPAPPPLLQVLDLPRIIAPPVPQPPIIMAGIQPGQAAPQAGGQAGGQAGQQAAAPALLNGKLRGPDPYYFSGDRADSEEFIDRFNLLVALNDNHEIMDSPYLRTMFALSLIKGPLVKSWVKAQVSSLRDKVTRQNNPIGRDQEILWNDFEQAFTAAYTDLAKTQNATAAFDQLKMRGEDLDTYNATFEQLAQDAGFSLDNPYVHTRYARGLNKGLLHAIMSRDTEPNTFTAWKDAAQIEQRKKIRRQVYMYPQERKFEWRIPMYQKDHFQMNRKNPGHSHDGDPRPFVPMDVDAPIFTQVKKAYTKQQKNHLKAAG